ncbi:hypothetical protein [Amycolatopsis anabasis]|uniref:hypothetical protein n=1 Tax=Amycolatopsis anabasis TaxID=1840409 RepID=UPI00131E0794|nr:hypothetical protein [Amycolatopsis anabasis]
MRDSGNVRADIDPGFTAMAIITAIQGGVAILMSTGSARYLESALDLCLDHLRPAGAAS